MDSVQEAVPTGSRKLAELPVCHARYKLNQDVLVRCNMIDKTTSSF